MSDIPLDELMKLDREQEQYAAAYRPMNSIMRREARDKLLLSYASTIIAEIASLRTQLADAKREIADARARAIEDAAKVIYPLCRDGVELVPAEERHYGGWHQLTELGGAADGGTDYEKCRAQDIRSLSPAPAAEGGRG